MLLWHRCSAANMGHGDWNLRNCRWLVVGPPLWKIWKSIGMIIPNIWENQTWQPKTTNQLVFPCAPDTTSDAASGARVPCGSGTIPELITTGGPGGRRARHHLNLNLPGFRILPGASSSMWPRDPHHESLGRLHPTSSGWEMAHLVNLGGSRPHILQNLELHSRSPLLNMPHATWADQKPQGHSGRIRAGWVTAETELRADWGFLIHRGTPSYHSFSMGFSLTKHPAVGVYPILRAGHPPHKHTGIWRGHDGVFFHTAHPGTPWMIVRARQRRYGWTVYINSSTWGDPGRLPVSTII